MRRRLPRLAPGRLAAVAWLAGLANACGPAGPPGAPPELGVGASLPDLELSGERPALVWVLAAEQCLGCALSEPARALRRLQRRLGERFETVVVAVGEGADEARLVSEFLRSQRISARVETRTPKRYARDFGSAPLSVFHVANPEGVIEAVVEADSAEVWRSAVERRDLAGLVEALAREGVASTGEGPGTL